jgi:hypothetical protein
MCQNNTSSVIAQAVVRMSAKHLSYGVFRRSWSQSEPMVVTDVQHTLQGSWNPDYFKQTFGHQSVTVIDCETNEELKSTVRDFFETFGSPVTQRRTLKIKVRMYRRILLEPYFNTDVLGLASPK